MSDLKNETIAILLDPFGARAFGLITSTGRSPSETRGRLDSKE